MRIFRGREATIEADLNANKRLLKTASRGETAIRVWTPHRQIVFGKRDKRREGYTLAKEVAHNCGFGTGRRNVGGHAVAYDGETTVAFARAEPISEIRSGTEKRYKEIMPRLEVALRKTGVDPIIGEPENSFCPGKYSISVTSIDGKDRKVLGVAQRVQADAALISGVLIVDNHVELSDILSDIYSELDIPFEPKTIGSIASGGASPNAEEIKLEIEKILTNGQNGTVGTV